MIYDLEIGLYKHIIEEYDEQYFHFYKTDDMFLKEMIVRIISIFAGKKDKTFSVFSFSKPKTDPKVC